MEEKALDGAKLAYFPVAESGRNNAYIAYLNGTAAKWWTRTPTASGTETVWLQNETGGGAFASPTAENGIRPALVLESSTLVIEQDDGSYSIAGSYTITYTPGSNGTGSV